VGGYPIENNASVIRNFEPQNFTPNISPSFYPILSIFSGMEDPLKIFQTPPKFSLNLLPVLHNKIGKLVLGIPKTHLLTVFRVKNGCNRFLVQKYKIDAVWLKK